MKKNICIALAALFMFVLTACQAAPTATPALDFFKDQPERWISVRPPAGWVATPGGTSESPSVIMTDDWKGYQKSDGKAIGITISPLKDMGTATLVLQVVINRLKNSLTQPASKVMLEQVGGQNYASVEYLGYAAEAGGTSDYYFLTVISTDKRSVLVFTACPVGQQERVRPAFQNGVKAITLH